MKSILVGLTLTLWILWCPGYTQTDSVYCLPIGKARLLVADALRGRLSDSLLNTISRRVDLLESEKRSSFQSFTNLLKIEREKFSTQKEITSDFIRWGESWRDQAEYFRKRERKARVKNKLLGAAVLVLTGLIIVK